MASKRLSFEEAVEELRNPTPGAMLWAWAYDYNPDNADLWTGMTGNTEADELDAQYGPFILTTEGENEPLDYSVLTDEERAHVHQDMLDDEIIAVCPADGEEYERADDLSHELHDSEHPNHHKFCYLNVGHWHEAIGDGDDLLQEALDRGPNDDGILPLATVRFDPNGAYDRLNSFVSVFEDDGVTDTTTLQEALKVLSDLIDATNIHHERYNGAWAWNADA